MTRLNDMEDMANLVRLYLKTRTGELAQQLKAFTDLAEDPG